MFSPWSGESSSAFFFDFASAGRVSAWFSGRKSDSLDLKSICHTRTNTFSFGVSLLLAVFCALLLLALFWAWPLLALFSALLLFVLFAASALVSDITRQPQATNTTMAVDALTRYALLNIRELHKPLL